MQDLRREGAGAILTERCNSLVDLRARGTVTGNPYIVAGPRGGRGINMSAVTECVEFTAQGIVSGTYSVSFWFKTTTRYTNAKFFDFRKGGGTGYVWQTATNQFGASSGTTYIDGAASSTFPTDTAWHHYAVTGITIASNDWYINCSEVLNDGHIGAYADIHFWPRALTAAEVLQEHAGSTWDYNLAMTHRWDLSSLASPDHVGTVNMVDTGLVASTDIVASPYGGYATQYNGTDKKSTAGDVGTVRSVSFMVRPDSTGAVTEEIILLSTGNDIMVSGGTITYAGVTASATYVDGVETTALVAGKWQHVVCVLSADHAATAFAVGTDGTNFGAISIDDVRTYSTALTNLVAADMARRATGGL